MTAAVVVLAASLAASLAAVVLMAWRLIDSVKREARLMDSLVLSGKSQVETDRELQRVVVERDAALLSAEEHKVSAAKSMRTLQSCQLALNSALAKGGRDAVDKIRNAPSGDAAIAALHDLLSPVPGVPTAGEAGAATAATDPP